jgi:site-specific recombinase XerD
VNEQTMRFWSTHTGLWRWLCARRPILAPADVARQDLLDYVDHGLSAGYAVSTINNHLRSCHAFLLFLQEQDYHIPQALLRVPTLKQPDTLPRFLTDEQVCLLRDDFERRVAQAQSPPHRRDALLDRAAFYLLWHAGLRRGEVEELRLEDLDLTARRLTVRQGKGQQDRTVYLTGAAAQALRDYLAARGLGPTDHVFLYRNRPLSKDLIHGRIRAAGERVGVKVSPHRLRHTCATQLLNAGCRVTSIQKLLGHRRLNSTMIYARAHDRTVADDYYTAMAEIEKRLQLGAETDVADDDADDPVSADERTRLLELVDRLAEPQLGLDARLSLVEQMRAVLRRETPQESEADAESDPLGESPWSPARSCDRMDAPARRVGLCWRATRAPPPATVQWGQGHYGPAHCVCQLHRPEGDKLVPGLAKPSCIALLCHM